MSWNNVKIISSDRIEQITRNQDLDYCSAIVINHISGLPDAKLQ